MITVHVIAWNAEHEQQDVITFTADTRDSETLLYAYCSGVQAKLPIALVSGNERLTCTAGEAIRQPKHPQQLTPLAAFIELARKA